MPHEVAEEIVEPRQAAALAEVLAKGLVRPEPLTQIPALALYAELLKTMGRGEAACLSLAVTNGWMIASDEKRAFRREVLARVGPGRLLNTPGILLLAIRRGVLSVPEADAALAVLAERRFRVKFRSFRELLNHAAE
jgi:predicted nucleic acid-binding protein